MHVRPLARSLPNLSPTFIMFPLSARSKICWLKPRSRKIYYFQRNERTDYRCFFTFRCNFASKQWFIGRLLGGLPPCHACVSPLSVSHNLSSKSSACFVHCRRRGRSAMVWRLWISIFRRFLLTFFIFFRRKFAGFIHRQNDAILWTHQKIARP